MSKRLFGPSADESVRHRPLVLRALLRACDQPNYQSVLQQPKQCSIFLASAPRYAPPRPAICKRNYLVGQRLGYPSACCGHEIAIQTAKALLIETRRAWQSGFAIIPLKTDHSDDAISGAQEWMHKNFTKTFSLEDPARRIGMSVRNFVRRFKQATGDSPLVYVQKLRIAAAKQMLESNHRSMQEIGDAVGYQEAVCFSVSWARSCFAVKAERAVVAFGR